MREYVRRGALWLLCSAAILAAIGCGHNGNGDGSTIGQSDLRLTSYGDPMMFDLPAYDFDFSTGEMLTGNLVPGAGGDVSFLLNYTQVFYYLRGNEAGGIIDLGTVELASVTEAPETGYSGSVNLGGQEIDQDWSLLVGRTFCVRTRDGAHYAKMKIVDADESAQTITFDWVYLPEGGRVFP